MADKKEATKAQVKSAKSSYDPDTDIILAEVGFKKVSEETVVFCQIRQIVTPSRVNPPRIHLGQMIGSGWKTKVKGISPVPYEDGFPSKADAIVELIAKAKEVWPKAIKKAEETKRSTASSKVDVETAWQGK